MNRSKRRSGAIRVTRRLSLSRFGAESLVTTALLTFSAMRVAAEDAAATTAASPAPELLTRQVRSDDTDRAALSKSSVMI